MPNDTVKSVIFGATVWYGAAFFVSKTRNALWDNQSKSSQLYLFIGSIPITYSFIFGLKYIGIPNDLIVESASIATATATLLDGVALTWLPGLYGARSTDKVGVKAPAWLLWAVGWGLIASVHVKHLKQSK